MSIHLRRSAYFRLKREAAGGVDGVTWEELREDLGWIVGHRFQMMDGLAVQPQEEPASSGSVCTLGAIPKGASQMAMQFLVCFRVQQPRWVVRIDDRAYGDCLDREQALLDAIDAAKDARDAGGEAQVWDQ